MADKSEWYGDKKPYETVARDEAWAESKTASFSIVGKYDDLVDKEVMPGTPLSNLDGWIDAPSGNWFVRTSQVTREEGDAGVLHISAVRVMKTNDGKPYNYIWQVSMEAVEKRLITHPKVKSYIDILQKWEDTPARWKYYTNKQGELEYRYATGKMIGDLPETVKITAEDAVNYCKAVTAGITSFNVYLPVMTKTTYYLEVPGCDYDKDHVITGGKVKLSDAGSVGCWDTPDVTTSAIPSAAQGGSGNWFKSMDSLTENADGTSTRTEQWTYTNDAEHSWIYDKSE